MVSEFRKWFSIALIVVVIVNMVLFGFGAVSASIFLGVIVLAAVITYLVLPKIKK
ncbi:MAG: hypothetical protein ABIH53_00575 [archaeon]